MVGSAIVRELQRQGYTNIITRTHRELDLTRQDQVEAFFAQERPEYVFLASAWPTRTSSTTPCVLSANNVPVIIHYPSSIIHQTSSIIHQTSLIISNYEKKSL